MSDHRVYALLAHTADDQLQISDDEMSIDDLVPVSVRLARSLADYA